MDAFTADYLTNLAAELSAPIVARVARRFQEKWQPDKSEPALRRCVQAGILGMVSRVSLDVPHEAHLLTDIFTDFFGNRDVAREMTRLIYVQPLSVAELAELFNEAGYDPETLPGLCFPEAVAAFEAAFLETAAAEPALQPIIQIRQTWAQTTLQRDMVALMRQMVAALQAQTGQPVGIKAGHIVAGNVVSGTQIIYQWPQQRPLDDSARTAYLTWLMDERQNLPLRAVRGAKVGEEEQPPDLAQVYVALDTTATKETGAGRDERVPLSALAALAEQEQMVLLGEPGSGKSTFASHLAYCLAAHTLYPTGGWLARLPDWPQDKANLLPVLLVLRDFARWLPDPLPETAAARHLRDFLVAQLEKEVLENAWSLIETALQEKRALILLDGLDEVTTPAQRRFVRDVVQKFARRYGGNHVLITCRVYSYQPPDAAKEEEELRLPQADYPAFTLAPFNDKQRHDFIRAWYGELKRQGYLPGADENRLSRDLQRAIRQSDMAQIAGNPLLLTVMAMVHMEEGRLPDSRALLYDKTIDLLLSRWEETKAEDAVPLLRQLLQEARQTEGDLKRRLAAVAFTVHTQAGTANSQMADIGETYLCEALSYLHKKDLGWGQRLLAVIKTRAGLLIERTPGQFAFPHRTFQEYLAGVHLATQPTSPDKPEPFADRALVWAKQDVGWWPMVLFGVEYLVYVASQPLEVLPLLSQLCPEQEDTTPAAWRLVWLAGQVLLSLGQERAEENEWGQQLNKRVRQRLATLLDEGHLAVQERADAGRVLARLGDPRPGVGVDPVTGLPDIAWGEEVPAGTYRIGGDERAYQGFESKEVTIDHPFKLAQYPVTYAQFQCFVEAEDFADGRWWAGMPANSRELREPAFPFANHPRERVSWYQATAFCRWLSDKLGYKVELPREYEWEVAARWPDGRHYPWGDEFDKEKANTREGGIGQTTAVGLYPSGQNEALGLHDLSGNVWEWCRNKYGDPNDDAVDESGDERVLRGGSWGNYRPNARASDRISYNPDSRDNFFGFRLGVVVRPPSQGH